jgi:membrane-bound acyltransferase YfiQ involved in biofilm formation
VPPAHGDIVSMFWGREGWMLFLGWISYFVLGFYTGIYYETLMKNIKKYTMSIIIGTILAAGLLICNYVFGVSTWVESKRFDIPIYVTMVILMFFLFSSYIKYVIIPAINHSNEVIKLPVNRLTIAISINNTPIVLGIRRIN